MFFNTWQFALFALIAVIAYRVAGPSIRAYVLIFLGIAFYAAAGVWYLLLMVAIVLGTYAMGRLLQSAHKDRLPLILTLGIVALVGTLGFFKYTRWLSASAAAVLPFGNWHGVGPLVVPLAISFFTFEFIHFLADVRAGKIQRFTFKDFLTFAFFFPTMVAGPIKRFGLFAKQLDSLQMARGPELQAAIYRILCGLFKKIAIADPVTVFTAPISHPQPGISAGVYALAMVAASAKIYYDLAGYSDIAIGFAHLFGVRVPENFARPYFAQNVLEFWRRWHISLSSWVRDYVFVPLAKVWRGGARAVSRRGRAVSVACLVVTMLVIGLWHGAAWQFGVWGLWNGFLMAGWFLWRQNVVPRVAWLSKGSLLLDVSSVALTYASFAFGLVFVAAPSTHEAMLVYRTFF